MKKYHFPVIAIGASAGGIKPLQTFFQQAKKLHAAYFVLIHGTDEQQQILVDILKASTHFDVVIANTNQNIQPNCIYLITNNQYIQFNNDTFRLYRPNIAHHLLRPIDNLFTQVAEQFQSQSVAVVLSGCGNDGSQGVIRIRNLGGIVAVQSPDEAAQQSMPIHAIAQEQADITLPVAQLSDQIAQLLQNDHEKFLQLSNFETHQLLKRVFQLLKQTTHYDFSQYKRNTLVRRIKRRIYITQHKNLPQYVDYLQNNSIERKRLMNELLIGVTQFFRDTTIWQYLEQHCLPELLSEKQINQHFRAWIAGCSTGEEAYSLAFLLYDLQQTFDDFASIKIQIFATDLDAKAISFARKGTYNKKQIELLTHEQQQRYFEQQGNLFQVKKSIRDLVIFAPHNLLSDPPFSQLDLLSCRNVMIYFSELGNKQLLEKFHYSLQPQGYLLLGMAESTALLDNNFSQVNTQLPLFKRKGELVNKNILSQQTSNLTSTVAQQYFSKAETVLSSDSQQYYLKIVEQLIPATLLVNANGKIINYCGELSELIIKASASDEQSVSDLLLPKLWQAIEPLFYQTLTKQHPIQAITELATQKDEKSPLTTTHFILIQCIPTPAKDMVVIALNQLSAEQHQQLTTIIESSENLPKVAAELVQLRHQLMLTQQEAQSSREELMSANEELQSTNEELTTSSEELRTMNEELLIARQHAERHLEQYSELFESAPVGYFSVNNSGHIERINRSGRHLLSQSDESTIGGKLSLYIVEKYRALFNKTFESVKETKTTAICDVALWHDDIELRYVSLTIAPQQNTQHYLIIAIDITEQHNIHQQLMIQEQELRIIFDHCADMIFVLQCDQYGDFIFHSANQAFVKKILTPISTNASVESIKNQLLSDLSILPKSLTHHDIYFKTLRSKTPQQQTIDFTIGDKILYCNLSVELVTDSKQLPRQLICTLHDVTDYTIQQQQLQESKARFARILSGTNDGLWEWDITQDVTFISSRFEKLLGYEEGELTETSNIFYSRLKNTDKPMFTRAIFDHIEHNKPFDLELLLQTKSGQYRWFRAKATAIRDEYFKPILLSGTLSDLHQQKLLQHHEIAKNKVLELAAKNAPLVEILHKIIEMVEQDHPNMICSILLTDEQHQHLVTSISNKLPDFYSKAIEGVPIAEGIGSCGTAAFRKEQVIVTDIQTDPLWKNYRDLAKQAGLAACWSQPIMNQHNLVIGTFAIYHKQPTEPSLEDIKLIEQQGVLVEIVIEHAKAQEKLKMASLVYENSSEASMVFDKDNLIIAVNPAFSSITGYTEKDVVGKPISLLNSPKHDRHYYDSLLQQLDKTGSWQGEIWGKRKNGELYAQWLSINTIYDNQGQVAKRVALFNDITEQKKSQELIWHQANFDSLTELPNRRMFFDRLQQETQHADRDRAKLAVMLIDLDNFKEVNDSYGHQYGDILLIEASQRISRCIRKSDTVARLGGDEFTVILTDIIHQESVDKIALNILQQLQKPFHIDQQQFFITGSIGIALYPDDATQPEHLLKFADQAMYQAKDEGKNKFCYFTAEMQQQAKQRLALLNDLRIAINEQQFELFYQPILHCQQQKIVKAEALIRWNHPTKGQISPMLFIPLAEDTGLIREISDWVVKTAINQLKQWQQTLDPHFALSLNISAKHFKQDHDLIEQWAFLAKENLTPRTLTVEITEGLLLEANTNTKQLLSVFSDADINIALDDFGTGYSSLAYLKKFTLDFLKIDQSFVKDMDHDNDDLALCHAIIAMAHQLGLKVIAEGVEQQQHLTLLTDYGCDYLQGYYFSKPVKLADFELLIKQQNEYPWFHY
jgi:diguanylate cyclase (GGDEF)-like protein/PAS domain S-box-containing protein